MPRRLLFVSNGYGEDSIAAAIVRRLPPGFEAAAYPVIGDGLGYGGVCSVVGPRSYPASHGSRVTRGSLLRDIGSGVLGSIGPSLRFLRAAAATYDEIVVVGDLLMVFAAWLAGVRGLTLIDVYKTGFARPYRRIEIAAIRRSCRIVFTRHPALAEALRAVGVDARAAGNVMMDTIPRSAFDAAALRTRRLAVTLLPGSRDETAANFALQIEALRLIPEPLRPDIFLALAGGVDPASLARAARLEWNGVAFVGDLLIHAARGALGNLLEASDVVLALSGTAATQAIGMGRPAITFARAGERARRHRDESRMFGEARILVSDDAAEVAAALEQLLVDDADRLRRGAIGRERIGPPGAIAAIVAELSRPRQELA